MNEQNTNTGESVDVETLELEETQSIDESEKVQGKKVISDDRYLTVVKDVEIQLSARLGNSKVTVGDLFDLKEGGVLSLDKQSNEPIDLMLGDQLVAKGNLVIVDDQFGVQITEVCDL